MPTKEPAFDDSRWVPVPNFDGYMVHPDGFVKSIVREVPIILSGFITKSGYHRICLNRESEQSKFQIHRIVAQAFIPNPDNKPQVNHKNGNKLDNRAENLEWCTGSENTIHKFRVLGYISHRRKISEIDVLDIIGAHFVGATRKDIAAAYGVSYPLIKLVIREGINYRMREAA